MRKISFNKRGIILFTLLFLLVAPFIQYNFKLVKVHALKGWIPEPINAKFSLKSWFSGEYQQSKEQYLNDAFGFRPFFVKLNNQIAYTFFGKVKANGVVIGKENYLFEENYIKAYYGTDFVGRDSIAHRMQRLKFIQDTLAKLNKSLVVVFAAGKGSFYPEYFPDEYKTTKGITNYQYHTALAKQLGINHIDFNRYFLAHKHNSKYPLYPKYGIHWSYYGSCLAADSIVRFVEKIHHADLPNLFWNEVDMHSPKDTDYDIGDALNLFVKLPGPKLAYPSVQVESDSGKVRPSLLVVSDSFYWGMYNFGVGRAFSNDHFWFYNKQVYPDSFQSPIDASQLDIAAEIAKHDVILIMATEATLPNLGWGFIENVYNHFKGIRMQNGRSPEFIKRMNEYRSYIKNDAKWMEGIAQRAETSGLSVDSLITIDAIWQVEQEQQKAKK